MLNRSQVFKNEAAKKSPGEGAGAIVPDGRKGLRGCPAANDTSNGSVPFDLHQNEPIEQLVSGKKMLFNLVNRHLHQIFFELNVDRLPQGR